MVDDGLIVDEKSKQNFIDNILRYKALYGESVIYMMTKREDFALLFRKKIYYSIEKFLKIIESTKILFEIKER